MNLVSLLRNGTPGVHLDVPAAYEEVQSSPNFALLVDRARGLGLTLHVADVALDVDPASEQQWREDVELHARAMFEHCFTDLPRERPGPDAPRTTDATWSPVISTGRVRLGAVDGLTVVHRLSYEPGHESVMGHVLVPLTGRTLELRVTQTARQTGMRETMLLVRAQAAEPGTDPALLMRRLGQRHWDDPAHDAEFPHHPLSLVRAAIAELCQGRLTAVTAPPPRDGPLELAGLGVLVTPPARHAPVAAAPDAPVVQLTRVSLSCTDGVRTLTLVRIPDLRADSPEALMQSVESLVRASVPPQATDVTVAIGPQLPGDRTQIEARINYKVAEARATAMRWLTLRDGAVLGVASNSDVCVPFEALRADVAAICDSLQEIEPERPPRPWWKLW